MKLRTSTRAAGRYLRDAAVFAPCYVVLDWASYIDPVGPFNITPWNPQPALAIVWMMLGGLHHSIAVLAAILIADLLVRAMPGGVAIALPTAIALTIGYAAIAWALRKRLRDTGLRSTRELTVFVAIVVGGSGIVGAAFIGVLVAAGQLAEVGFATAWGRFWVGDAVGILVTAPLLFGAADAVRRRSLIALMRTPEALGQAAVLGLTVWLIFKGFGTDPSRQFYLLFLPLIWIAVRSGLNGAILATAVVQIGVVFGIHAEAGMTLPVLELQALLAALTLTALFLGVTVDQRQRAEASLRESLRLAAAGEMAGSIAHEINQPLTAATNYGRAAQMLLERDGSGQVQGKNAIAKFLSEIERAAEIVRRLRDFFRAGTTRLAPVEAAALIDSACRMAGGMVDGTGIVVESSCEEGLPPLYADQLQIELVLRNLVANAVESLRALGRPAGRIQLRAQRDGERVRFVVADSGPGIPASLGTLFEPFVSSKPTGMGLGLAVSKAIAEAHGGTLESAATTHGEFHLVLPCTAIA